MQTLLTLNLCTMTYHIIFIIIIMVLVTYLLFRSQSVRDSFKALIIDFKRIEESTHSSSSTGSPLEGSLLAELCRHLCQFSQARQELIDFYESMAIMGSSSNVNYSDLSNMIDEICRRYGKSEEQLK